MTFQRQLVFGDPTRFGRSLPRGRIDHSGNNQGEKVQGRKDILSPKKALTGSFRLARVESR